MLKSKTANVVYQSVLIAFPFVITYEGSSGEFPFCLSILSEVNCIFPSLFYHTLQLLIPSNPSSNHPIA